MKPRDQRGRRVSSIALAWSPLACGDDALDESARHPGKRRQPTPAATSAPTHDRDPRPAPAETTADSSIRPRRPPQADGSATTLRFTLDQLLHGTEGAPPTDGPAAQPDKSVWVISCGEAVPSCVGPTAGAMEAGEAIGWDMTLFDGQLDPTRYGDGIRQAIAADADGVIIAAIDCRVAEAPLREANAAGITVVAFYSIDCEDPTFDAEVQFNGYDGLDTSYSTVVADWGASKARYLIDKLDGDVQVISFREDDLQAVTSIYEGFERELATCATCSIVETIEFTFPDLLTPTGLRDQTIAADPGTSRGQRTALPVRRHVACSDCRKRCSTRAATTRS